ncbi:MAG: PAS domain-containing protein, partial [Bacteroidota bacterium]|nr:PAS domain-containing protein [Bacteroidota bacterium]
VNKAYEKISGLNENQMINNSLFKILPDFEPQLVTLFKNVVTTGVSDGYERFNKIWGRHLSVRAFTPEKDILVCFVEDITQKKLEEIKIINQKAELEEANKKLKLTIEQLVKAQERQTKSEQSLKRLVENMPLGIATLKVKTDEKGYPVDFIFHSINKETEKLFKLKASEIIGKSICEIFPDIEPKYFKIYANVAITGESAYYERFNKTINKYIFVKLYLSEKNILVSFFEDVTEKRLEESKIKNQKIELEQVNKQLKIANEEIENAYTKIKQINIENFKILFEMINIGTAQLEIISDQFDNPIDFKFLNANIAFEKITGLNINKIIGKTLMDIFPDSGHKWIELYGKSALLGKRIEYVNYNAKINSYFIAVIYYLGENNVAVLTDKIDKETYEKKLIDLKKNE